MTVTPRHRTTNATGQKGDNMPQQVHHTHAHGKDVDEQEMQPSEAGDEHHPLLGRATSAPEMGHPKPHYGTLQGHAPLVRSLGNVFAWQRVYSLVVAAGLGGLLLGYNSSNIAVALPLLEVAFASVAESNVLKEAIVSITTLGSALGGFVGGFASDFFGRRSVIIASDFIFIGGGLMMGFARTDVELIIGRAVVGVGIGVASIVVPVYIAEVSPKGIRAMLIVLYSLQIGVGLCLAFAGGFAFTFTSLTWRAILAAPVFAALLQLALMGFLPESPRWLALNGRLQDAETVMRTIQTVPPTVDPLDQEGKDIDHELKEVYKEGKYLRTEEGQKEAWNIRTRPVVIQLALGVGLSCLHSLAGARTIMYYSLEIIKMAGFDTELAIMQSIFTMGSFGTLGLIMGFFLIDRIGRRMLVIISGGGVFFSLAMLSASFGLAAVHSPEVFSDTAVDGYNTCPGAINNCAQCLAAGCGYCSLPPGIPGQYHNFPGHCFAGVEPGNNTAFSACETMDAAFHLYKDGCPSGFGWMSMAALCLFQTFFQLGLGLIPAVVNAEYYPARVRGLCNGIAVTSNWLSNFFVSSTFLSVDQVLGTSATFGIYAAMVLVGTVILAFTLPETSGLSFPEIQAMFEIYGMPDAPPPWKLHEGRPRQEKKGGLPLPPVDEIGGGCCADFCGTRPAASGAKEGRGL